MNKKILSAANSLRFIVVLSALLLSACAGVAAPGASSSSASAVNALAGVSIAALPQLGQIFFTGNVQAISDSSLQVADIAFRVDDQTSLARNLTVGTPVRVRALALPDATRYAVDVQRSESLDLPASVVTFNFHDTVVSIGDTSWQIGDQTVLVDTGTQIEAGILVGDMVEVNGVVVDGKLQALSIELFVEETPTPTATPTVTVTPTETVTPTVTPTPIPSGEAKIEVTGELLAMDSASLKVDGLTFAITPETEIKDNPQVGDIVTVDGLRASDGSLTALEVRLAENPEVGVVKFEVKGVVESITDTLWVIGGFNIQTDATTQIASGLAVGDMAMAEGTIQPDGTMLASEIKAVETGEGGGHGGVPGGNRIKFSGVVQSISADMWVISGQTVAITPDTMIKGSPQVGDYVMVEALDVNGVITANQIKSKNDNSPMVGESRFNGIVESISDNLWVVSGVSVAVTSDTVIKFSPQVGDFVQVKVFDSGGTLTAHEIKLLMDVGHDGRNVGPGTATPEPGERGHGNSGAGGNNGNNSNNDRAGQHPDNGEDGFSNGGRH
ncbi:hypothetical protein LARV_00578 [Longilinea arvoryzae]|uniref:DUF5666 domain-containing protein n=1 Tax=Longilinea arvoryzae TaxID=360412 RepID=A0A0S7BEK2_9CHLR|nr:DUF5666 domain-containing protein [Longilinea arvoryzae]GAP12838.1 hypothetical protein LARV_00578 [Longilinea arvoryzae]